MNNGEQDQAASSIADELQRIKATLARLEGSRQDMALPDMLRAALPKHFQEAPMDKEARRSLLWTLPRCESLPAVLKDGNDLALRGITNKMSGR